MVKKKNELSYYPSFFFSKLVFRTISWAVFAFMFIGLGKKYLKTDILGKIYQSIFDKKKDFNQYFLGANKIVEKNKILNYAIFFLAMIVVLNIIALWINTHLWKKDKYVENNDFYLHNKWIFIINSLIHISCAFLLTFSFVSFFTVILALLFISFNSQKVFPRQKKSRNPQTESFFSWKKQYVYKIVIYSFVVIFVIPLIIGRFQEFHQKSTTGSPEGFAEVYQKLIKSSEAINSLMELITKANYSLFHWFILFWFARGMIGERKKEFGDFWTKVNGIEKRVTDFKHYYYYQESWALANNKRIELGDYNYLENNPVFLSKGYLESDFNIEVFAQENKKVVKYIEFCGDKIKEPPKRNFLNYCLFNEFNSWEDCLRTRKLIKAARKQ